MYEIKKKPNIAAILGIFPGLGFLYLGNTKKFFMFFGVTLIALLVGMFGNTLMIFMGIALSILGAVYAYTEAEEAMKSGLTVKVDPHFALSCSFLWDGVGQFLVGKRILGIFMAIFGLTPCLIAWMVMVPYLGVVEMATVLEGSTFTITNILIMWLMFSIPIKALSMIDAYYSSYHMFVAKK